LGIILIFNIRKHKKSEDIKLTVRAIILAAGINSRLRNYVTDVPKCLLPIGSNTILERQIDFLIKSGLQKEDIIVVTGHMDEKIRLKYDGLLFNERYKETDNSYSLHIALSYLLKLPQFRSEDDVLVFDCDLIYHEDLLSKVINSESKNVLVTRKEHLPEMSREEVIFLDDVGRITKISRFCEEDSASSFKKNSQEQFVYTGILKMSGSAAKKLNQILLAKKSWTKWYTVAFAELFYTVSFFNFPLSGALFCCDVDTKEDYEKVCDLIKEK
jgi:choline kinase